MNNFSTNRLFILFILKFVVLSNTFSLNAQTCVNPPLFDNPYVRSWSQHSPVTVNIDPSYSTEQRTAIHDAFVVWQNASGNLWGILYSFTYNSTPISGTNTHQVTKTNPASCPVNQVCQAETGGTNNGTRQTSAYTNINPLVTNATALKQTMIHEIGHSFGLYHCFTCAQSDTVMAQATSLNDTGGRESLSSCDVLNVNTLYQQPSCAFSVEPTNNVSCHQGIFLTKMVQAIVVLYTPVNPADVTAVQIIRNIQQLAARPASLYQADYARVLIPLSIIAKIDLADTTLRLADVLEFARVALARR